MRHLPARIVATAMAAIVLTMLVPPAPARACSCMEPRPADVVDWLDQADAAFVGTPTSRGEPTPGPDGLTDSGQSVDMTFDVKFVAKGDLTTEVVVRTASDGAACGLEGRARMAVLLRGSEEFGWASDLCSVVPIEVLADVSDFRAPTAATAADPGASPPTSPWLLTLGAVAVGAAMLAVVLAVLIARRARRT